MASDPRQSDALVPPLVARLAAWSWRLLVIAAAAALVGYLFWTLKGVTVPIFVALLLSTALSPVVDGLKERGAPTAVAVVATLLGFFLLLIGFSVLVVGTLTSDLTDLGEALATGTADVSGWLSDHSGPLKLNRAEVEAYLEDARAAMGLSASDALSFAAGGFSAFFGVVGGGILVVAFLAYMLTDGRSAAQWLVALFPEERRVDAKRIGNRAWVTLGGYLRGVTLVATFDAVLIGAGLFLLDVPYAGALTALVFLLAYIPILGAWISGIVAVIVTFAGDGIQPAIAVAVISLVVQQLEGLVVSPIVYRHSVKLHPIVTLAVVTGGGIVAGVVGAFLAVPITALVWSVIDESLKRRLETGSAAKQELAGLGRSPGT